MHALVFSCDRYHALVNYLDTMVGELRELLVNNGMYENTLFVFSGECVAAASVPLPVAPVPP